MYVLGLDVGTQGVRSVVLDEHGVCYARAEVPFPDAVVVEGLPEGCSEQDPRYWVNALEHVVLLTLRQLRDVEVRPEDIRAVAVDATSGTILAVDAEGKPLRPALMYNDSRAREEAAHVNDVAADHCERHGYRVSPTFALPKLLWLARNEPQTVERAAHFVHQADYLAGRLTGRYDQSDFSNALKTCYDLVDLTWPAFLDAELGVPMDKLPEVRTPGAAFGTVDRAVAERLGLSPQTVVAAGCTDGTAGFLASGAGEPGESCTTLGTTIVVRGVGEAIVRDPQGRLYSHRHPDGMWLPGGASNVGCECLREFLPDCDHAELTERVRHSFPIDILAYPLVRPGERLPFADPTARGFFTREPRGNAEMYAACLQGVALVERWCYAVMDELGCRMNGVLYTVGGGARNPVWCQLRADLLGRRVRLARMSDSAVGAAMLAARSVAPDISLQDLMAVREEYEPNHRVAARYDELYARFREACAQRGLGHA